MIIIEIEGIVPDNFSSKSRDREHIKWSLCDNVNFFFFTNLK